MDSHSLLTGSSARTLIGVVSGGSGGGGGGGGPLKNSGCLGGATDCVYDEVSDEPYENECADDLDGVESDAWNHGWQPSVVDDERSSGRDVTRSAADANETMRYQLSRSPDREHNTSSTIHNVCTRLQERTYSSILRRPSGPVAATSSVQASSVDWNEIFQRALEAPASNAEENAQRVCNLLKIVEDFERHALPHAKIIIEEHVGDVPHILRTIPVSNVGGVAGGEHFIYDGIFFKFAHDAHGLYGNDEFAMKAAGLELMSVQALMDNYIPNLHFPLMLLVDYLGHRLIVMPLLPISKKTLVYGSDDGGKTVKNSSPEMDAIMRRMATALNIKGHLVGPRRLTAHLLHGPADLEGHLGTDGRYYVIDFARLFPPEPPPKVHSSSRHSSSSQNLYPKVFPPRVEFKNTHLFRLLRPEVVKTNPLPLSSDAFSTMGRLDRVVHDNEVKSAYKRLVNEVIPLVGKTLSLRYQSDPAAFTTDHALIRNIFKQHGVNMRHAGRVYDVLSDANLKNLLICEMLARCIKQETRTIMRQCYQELHESRLAAAAARHPHMRHRRFPSLPHNDYKSHRSGGPGGAFGDEDEDVALDNSDYTESRERSGYSEDSMDNVCIHSLSTADIFAGGGDGDGYGESPRASNSHQTAASSIALRVSALERSGPTTPTGTAVSDNTSINVDKDEEKDHGSDGEEGGGDDDDDDGVHGPLRTISQQVHHLLSNLVFISFKRKVNDTGNVYGTKRVRCYRRPRDGGGSSTGTTNTTATTTTGTTSTGSCSDGEDLMTISRSASGGSSSAAKDETSAFTSPVGPYHMPRIGSIGNESDGDLRLRQSGNLGLGSGGASRRDCGTTHLYSNDSFHTEGNYSRMEVSDDHADAMGALDDETADCLADDDDVGDSDDDVGGNVEYSEAIRFWASQLVPRLLSLFASNTMENDILRICNNRIDRLTYWIQSLPKRWLLLRFEEMFAIMLPASVRVSFLNDARHVIGGGDMSRCEVEGSSDDLNCTVVPCGVRARGKKRSEEELERQRYSEYYLSYLRPKVRRLTVMNVIVSPAGLTEAFYKEQVRIRQRDLGEDHPDVAASLENWALMMSCGPIAPSHNSSQPPFMKEDSVGLAIDIEKSNRDSADKNNSKVSNSNTPAEQNECETGVSLLLQSLRIRRNVRQSAELVENSSKKAVEKEGTARIATDSERSKKVVVETTNTVTGLISSVLQEVYTLQQLSRAYQNTGDYDRCVSLIDEALKLCQKHSFTPPNLAELLHLKAWFLKDCSKLDEALNLYIELLVRSGSENTLRGQDDQNRAEGGADESEQGDAVPSGLFSLDQSDALRAFGGKIHCPPVIRADILVELARVFLHRGDVLAAIPLQEDARIIAEKALGASHSRLGTIFNNLGISNLAFGRCDEALKYIERSLDIRLQTLGGSHRQVGHSKNCLGQVYLKLGDYARASSLFEDALTIYTSAAQKNISSVKSNIARMHLLHGRFERAHSILTECVSLRSRFFGVSHSNVAGALLDLSIAEVGMSQLSSARECIVKATDIYKKALGSRHPSLVVAAEMLRLLTAYQNSVDREHIRSHSAHATRQAMSQRIAISPISRDSRSMTSCPMLRRPFLSVGSKNELDRLVKNMYETSERICSSMLVLYTSTVAKDAVSTQNRQTGRDDDLSHAMRSGDSTAMAAMRKHLLAQHLRILQAEEAEMMQKLASVRDAIEGVRKELDPES